MPKQNTTWTMCGPAARHAILNSPYGWGWELGLQYNHLDYPNGVTKIARGVYAFNSHYSGWVFLKVNVNVDGALDRAGVSRRGKGRGQWVAVSTETDARGHYFIVYGAATRAQLVAAVTHGAGVA